MGGALHNVALFCARRGNLGNACAVWQGVLRRTCERAGPFAQWRAAGAARGGGDPQRVPHLDRVSYEGKMFPCLIIILGRPPLCLRCRATGHLLGDCPGRSAAGTYAGRVARAAPDLGLMEV